SHILGGRERLLRHVTILRAQLGRGRIEIAKPELRFKTESGCVANPAIGSENTRTCNLAFQAIGHNQIAAKKNDECAHKPLITRVNPGRKPAFAAVAIPRLKDYCRNRSNGVPSAFADG